MNTRSFARFLKSLVTLNMNPPPCAPVPEDKPSPAIEHFPARAAQLNYMPTSAVIFNLRPEEEENGDILRDVDKAELDDLDDPQAKSARV